MHPHLVLQCKNIVNLLYKSRQAGPFREPVDPIALGVPDYFDVIKNPIDLGTIKTKLAKGEYESVEQCIADVRLVWSNCIQYNQAGSPIVAIAQNLSKIFEDEVARFDYNEPVANEVEDDGDSYVQESEPEEEFHEQPIVQNKGLSDYERIRLENIERNKQMMKSLGLDLAVNDLKPKVPVASPIKRKLQQKPSIQAPTRSSKRKKGFQNSPLFSAIREKNLVEFLQILSSSEAASQINEKNGINDETPLHLAVTLGDIEITKTLLSQDCIDIDAQDIRGWTPLTIAKINGFKEIAALLQEAGATQTDATEIKSPKKSSRVFNPLNAPQAPGEQNRCTCCHTCRTSLSLYPREYKACTTCPYIYCKNCFESKPFLKLSWDEVSKMENFECEVCIGSCVCSRCCTRGPPRWFGHKNSKFRDPHTAEAELNFYQEKAKEAIQERIQAVTTQPREKPPAQPFQFQQMCSCCHICRKSTASTGTPYKSCSTCSYIICKPCFGKRITQTWEDAEQLNKWSCTVCHGACDCSRCRKRGPPAWYGQLKKQMKMEKQSQDTSVIDRTSIIETASECLPVLEAKVEEAESFMNVLNFEEEHNSPDESPSLLGNDQSCVPSLFDESLPPHLFVEPLEYKGEMDIFRGLYI